MPYILYSFIMTHNVFIRKDIWTSLMQILMNPSLCIVIAEDSDEEMKHALSVIEEAARESAGTVSKNINISTQDISALNNVNDVS